VESLEYLSVKSPRYLVNCTPYIACKRFSCSDECLIHLSNDSGSSAEFLRKLASPFTNSFLLLSISTTTPRAPGPYPSARAEAALDLLFAVCRGT
jgi:hypothetical protein